MNFRQVALDTVENTEIANIADLEAVNIDEIDIIERTFGTGDNAFSVVGFQRDNTFYRVPKSVFSQVKVHLEADKTFTTFKVIKTGSGMKTQYTVMKV